MLTKHLCVLIHIRIKGEVGTVKLEVFHLWTFFLLLGGVSFVDLFFCYQGGVSFADLFCYLCLSLPCCLSVSCSFVVACWESADLLAVLCMMFACAFVTFTFGILGHMWYLIIWIPDICLLSYFKPSSHFLTDVPRRFFLCGSFMLFVFVFAKLWCLFIAALWSSVGKGLTSWLSCVFWSLSHSVSYSVSFPQICIQKR